MSAPAGDLGRRHPATERARRKGHLWTLNSESADQIEHQVAVVPEGIVRPAAPLPVPPCDLVSGKFSGSITFAAAPARPCSRSTRPTLDGGASRPRARIAGAELCEYEAAHYEGIPGCAPRLLGVADLARRAGRFVPVAPIEALR